MRPLNWEERKADRLLLVHEDYHWIYEAGANEILEAIWKMAKDSPTGTFTFDTNTINVF